MCGPYTEYYSHSTLLWMLARLLMEDSGFHARLWDGTTESFFSILEIIYAETMHDRPFIQSLVNKYDPPTPPAPPIPT